MILIVIIATAANYRFEEPMKSRAEREAEPG